MAWLRRSLERQWYTRPDWLWLLLPLSWLFQLLSSQRRRKQRRAAYQPSVPVVVIGNINVGGTGKTPTIINLAKTLLNRGYKPVVISRGYGTSNRSVRVLPAGASAQDYGDEPVLISMATGCPVVVGTDRVAVARHVEQQQLGDVILSDDGLQHYRLGRHWEIAVIDSERRLGNGHCLPLGPLREGPLRLSQVNAVLLNGGDFDADWLPQGKSYPMALRPVAWRHVKSGRSVALDELKLQTAVAIAGIGNPQRFFATLRSLGFQGATQAFADHHAFVPEDFSSFREPMVLMTEKDAVKVRAFAADHWWALVVEAQIPASLIDSLCQTLANFRVR